MKRALAIILAVGLAMPSPGVVTFSWFDSTAGDPSFGSVELLLHCDGADASTTFTDSSNNTRTVTANGNAQIDTAQSQFGGASGLYDGTGDYLSVGDAADLEPGAGDFTIECWVRFANVSGLKTIIGKRANIAGFGPIAIYANGTTLSIALSTNGTSWNITGASTIGTVAADTWYHVAVTRAGSTVRKFLNGVKNGTDVSTSSALVDNSAAVTVGADTNGQGHNGWIDEVRITIGVCRYTADFTPTGPFADS